MNKIWIIAENPETAYELTGKARALGEHLTVYLVGDQEAAQQAIRCGADLVKRMEIPATTVWEHYVNVLVPEAEIARPELILVEAGSRGKDLAAQLAARLGCPCVTDCKKLESVAGRLLLQRIVYGGLASQDLECADYPLVVTIAPHTFERPEPAPREGKIVNLPLAQKDSRVQVMERKAKGASQVNLAEAKVVIGVGRGLTDQSGLAWFEETARLLGGELGCTRPLAEDLGWLSEERYIGISGRQIKPDLYLCAGISGQVQHVFGIREAKTIVSIDKNENAPIFKVSDYYVVGNLEEVLPAFLTELKNHQS
ncbi:electron transfer flavoprotein subunit alpha/FixB family protein [Desulfitobacterium chlororespirans]|uniref:Electron transfer flavoprotein alpha subunit apoprotein n=1 Tax=Desulfitobacterium chlororespirans DSM 11544 TaxID=1121395 RepID=A0A1M7SY75_9FIRM|nr:electron transfer flavoprotein subunit alpha/FixB family protein [Desulfitobacterium chlororespirans]SHN63351.1 electron transfer flavoprotein alpha subunit apoprotein [Desulfitobacterium chlororespirans DSM 11544]